MDKTIVEKGLDYVKDFFEGEASGHDYFHTYRVFKNVEMLLKSLPEADKEICLLGAILHDVDDDKISPETHENKDNARKFLSDNNYPQDRIEIICKIIGDVSFSEGVKPESIEGKIVQDADRLDAIGAIGIARTFAYGGNKGRQIYNPDIKPDLTKSKQEQMLYILSAKNFEEGYRRFYYLSNLASKRKEQSLALSRTKKEIQNKRDKVNS